MRKTYNAPEMNVVEIQTAGMLAQSSFDLNSSSSEAVGGSSALSRESDGSFWDDDEDF